MQYRTSTFRRTTCALAVLGVLAACERSDTLIAPSAPLASSASLALEVSDANASNGQQVAIAIANESGSALGAVQGYLRFKPNQLRFRGQVRDAASNEILLVNEQDVARGELRLAALNAAGLNRTSPLVFDVLDAGYASSLSFVVEEAVLNGSPVARTNVTVDAAYHVNRALGGLAAPAHLSVQEWSDILSAQGTSAAEPGEIRNGLKFGDTNFDGNLTLADALYVINISVGLNEMIVGTDGTGPVGDRDAVVAGNVSPANSPGLGEVGDATPPGLEGNGSRVLSLADGLAIINEFVGVDQPVVGEIIPGRPLVPVSNRIVISANVTTNTTWTNGNIYELQGGIVVTNSATLTIQPGTLIEGQQGTGPGIGGAALFVARDGRLVADGTALQPIVFTCKDNGAARFKGCWGGISVLGNAALNDGALNSPIITGRATTGGCREKTAEGSANLAVGLALYGGCNDNDDSGIFRYIRVEYAGFRFTPTNELNGLALYGVGRGTIVDFVQIHAGLDDGLEMFGGTVNMKHIVATANSDDSFDYTEGWNGDAQFIIVQLDSLDSDKGFEQDNYEFGNDFTPRATPRIYNATVIGKAFVTSTSGTAGNNAVGGLHVRRGTWPKMFNFLVQNFPFALDIDDTATCTGWNTAAGFEIKNSIFTQNTRLDASDTPDPACEANESAAILLAGSNNLTPATSPLISPLDVRVPDWRPAFGTATGGAVPPGSFFDATATYIGAVAPANATKSNIPWYSGWTRGWATATTP